MVSGWPMMAPPTSCSTRSARLRQSCSCDSSKVSMLTVLALRCRRRLAFYPRKSRIEARPGRCLRSPNGGRGACNLGIVEGAGSHEDEVGPNLGFAEHRGTAGRTEPPMHHVPALGHAPKVTQFPLHLHGGSREAHIHGEAARAEVLAKAAPALSRHDGRGCHPVPHRAAQATPCNFH